MQLVETSARHSWRRWARRSTATWLCSSPPGSTGPAAHAPAPKPLIPMVLIGKARPFRNAKANETADQLAYRDLQRDRVCRLTTRLSWHSHSRTRCQTWSGGGASRHGGVAGPSRVAWRFPGTCASNYCRRLGRALEIYADMSLTITTSPWLKLPRLKDENCFRCFSDTTTVVLRSARSETSQKTIPQRIHGVRSAPRAVSHAVTARRGDVRGTRGQSRRHCCSRRVLLMSLPKNVVPCCTRNTPVADITSLFG